MKPDGVTMENIEPTEAMVEAEPSLAQAAATQEEVTQQAPSQPEVMANAQELGNSTAPPAPQEGNGSPAAAAAADSKAKPKGNPSKVQLAGASKPNLRPGTSTSRTQNGVKHSTNDPTKKTAVQKTSTTAGSASGAVPKRLPGAAAFSSVRTSTKVAEKKPLGPARTTSTAAATSITITHGTRPATGSGTLPKRPPAGPVNGARPKLTAPTSKVATSTAPKPSTSTAAKTDRPAVSRTTRLAAGPSTFRPSSSSKPSTAGPGSTTVKPSTAGPGSTTVKPSTAGPGTTTVKPSTAGPGTTTVKPSTAGPGTTTVKPSTAGPGSTTVKPSTAGPGSTTVKPSTAGPGSTTVKPSTAGPGTTTVKPSTAGPGARVTMAPSAGRTTAAQASKNNAGAKKDISRPASATAIKKPTATTLMATKKTEPSKLAATSRPDPASKRPPPTKAAEPKTSKPKAQESPKHLPAKKVAPPATRPYVTNRPALGRTLPGSPANKPVGSSTSHAAKHPKPTQSVMPSSPFTAIKKKLGQTSKTARAEAVAAVAAAVTIAEPAEVPAAQTEAEAAVPEMPPAVAAVPEDVPTVSLAKDTPAETVPLAALDAALDAVAVPSPPQSPVSPASPSQDLAVRPAPLPVTREQSAVPVEAVVQTGASAPQREPERDEEPVHLMPDQTASTSTAPPLVAAILPPLATSSNLNEEDEDEEEREGSQQVSVSDMSGTTQPTEESRPGSAGPAGASAWRAGGALLSELDSEEVSQQGASELSAPGVLEGTESMDDLGDGSLKGAIDMEGASAGSPDFERVPDIPANDFEEDEDDYEDRVCDMDVGSERAEDPQRARHDNEVVEEEEDEDVEMASEGVTESGLESYGNADEDDFAEDERLDNLNRGANQLPPPLLRPSDPAAQWDQPNPFIEPRAQPQQHLHHQSQPFQPAVAAPGSPSTNPWQADSETPTPAQIQTLSPAFLPVPGVSHSSTISSETSVPGELPGDYNRARKLYSEVVQANVLSLQPDPEDQDLGIHLEQGDREVDEEAETLPADEVLGGPATAPTSNASSSSTTEDEASDTEGEAQLEDPMGGRSSDHVAFDIQPPTLCSLSALEEGEEAGPEEGRQGAREESSPPSAASYGFDTMTTASNSQSTGDYCTKSPGFFSLEGFPDEAEEANESFLSFTRSPPSQPGPDPAELHYMQCGRQAARPVVDGGQGDGSEGASDPPLSLTSQQRPEDDHPTDAQPAYYSAICEKTENSLAGLPLPHRRDHSLAHPRPHCDIIIHRCDAPTPPRPPPSRSPGGVGGPQALSPQLRRLEQHQRQLLELQQRREQQDPAEEDEEGNEEERRKLKESEEKREQAEAKKRKELEKRKRGHLELQLQQQQQEMQQRQQIMQWQQELEEQQGPKGQSTAAPLSPSSGLCTIYEALENSDGEEGEGPPKAEERGKPREEDLNKGVDRRLERVTSDEDENTSTSTQSPPLPDSPHQRPADRQHPHVDNPPQDDLLSPSPRSAKSPDRPPPLDLEDWGKKVDIVQQLINQTLLLTRDGCSSLLLLPGGGGGTLSPLESSLWPSLLPPLTPPSATVTSVSSFSPEAPGSSPQGEWTVVELETHH